jgi:hypothetical protein
LAGQHDKAASSHYLVLLIPALVAVANRLAEESKWRDVNSSACGLHPKPDRLQSISGSLPTGTSGAVPMPAAFVTSDRPV